MSDLEGALRDAAAEDAAGELPPVDFSEIEIEPADDIVIPQSPEDIGQPPADSSDPNGDVRPESAADRVRARFRREGRAGRKGEPSTYSAPRRPVPKPRDGSLVKPLTQMYTSIGVMIAPFDQACSVAVIENAESCARSLETLARENEAVRRAILALTQTSAWGGVLIAHMPILLMVMMHHGPKEVAERVAPLAMMTNPGAMAKAAEAQAAAGNNAQDSAA